MTRFALLVIALASWIASAGEGGAAEAPGYTQPAHALVMPFDATEGRVSFLQVSRVDDGELPIAAHWVFWSDRGVRTAEFVLCLSPGETSVVDPRALPGGGDISSVDGERGFASVSAYAGATECGSDDGPAVDGALAGSFTLADLSSGAAFGHDALGFARSADRGHVDLPADPVGNSEVLVQTFAPDDLDFSVLVLLGLREGAGTQRFSGELGPLQDIRANASVITSFGRSRKLMDVAFSGALFVPFDETGLSLRGGVVPSSALLSLSNLSAGGRPVSRDPGDGNSRVFGLLGQSIGAFGTSTRLRTRGAIPRQGVVPAPRPTETPRRATPLPGVTPTPPLGTATPDPLVTPVTAPTGTTTPPPTATPILPPPTATPVWLATPSPSPTPSPTETGQPSYSCPANRRVFDVRVVASVPMGGAEVRLDYPPSLSIPGSAQAASVQDRLSWKMLPAGAVHAANDQDGTLRVGFVDVGEPGAREVILRISFDCVGGSVPVRDVPTCSAAAVGPEAERHDADCEVRLPND